MNTVKVIVAKDGDGVLRPQWFIHEVRKPILMGRIPTHELAKRDFLRKKKGATVVEAELNETN